MFDTYISGNISQHKNWELQTWFTSWTISAGLEARWLRKQDHGGISINIHFMGLTIDLDIRDSRHWDEDTDDWVIYT